VSGQSVLNSIVRAEVGELPVKPILWLCWFQGRDDSSLPELNRVCINRWIELNTDCADIKVLDNNNIQDYVPEYDEFVRCSQVNRRFAHKADLLRLLLLNKYGGMWADASTYPLYNALDIRDSIHSDVGFFAHRFKRRRINIRGNRDISNWFLYSAIPRHPLVSLWADEFITLFANASRMKYWAAHDSLVYLYDKVQLVRNVIDGMKQIYADAPHSLLPSSIEKYIAGVADVPIFRPKSPLMLKRPHLALVSALEECGSIDSFNLVLKAYILEKSMNQ
jgi:hypothetical protein